MIFKLLIENISERHPAEHKTFGINFPEAQRQQVKDNCLSAPSGLNEDKVVTIEEAVDGEDLRQYLQ